MNEEHVSDEGSDDTFETCCTETLEDTGCEKGLVALSCGSNNNTDDGNPCGSDKDWALSPNTGKDDDERTCTCDSEELVSSQLGDFSEINAEFFDEWYSTGC
jgi:hypothetical protein